MLHVAMTLLVHTITLLFIEMESPTDSNVLLVSLICLRFVCGMMSLQDIHFQIRLERRMYLT